MRDFTKLTFEECCIEIRKYKTLDEFKEYCPQIFNQILKFVDEEFFVTNRKHYDKFWNKENVFIAAMMCSSKIDFQTKFYRAYKISAKNKWFDNYIWFILKNKPHNYWKTEENCRKEALKYTTKTDFREKSLAAYTAACRYGYIKDYEWLSGHKPNNYWTKETFIEEAKKFNSFVDFQKKYRHVLIKKAYKNGWIDDNFKNLFKDDFFEDINDKENNIYDKEYYKQLSLQFETKQDFKKNYPKEYKICLKNKWIKEFDWLINANYIKGHCSKYSEDDCYNEAKKYKSFKDFRKNSYNIYRHARKQGYFVNYTWLEETYWNEQKCRKEALKYNSKKDFREKSSAAYAAACRYGYIKNYDWLSGHKANNYWTKEQCRKESEKYKTRNEFRINCRTAYDKSQINGWLDEFGFKKEEKIELTKEECIELASVCCNKTEFHKYWNYAFHYAKRHNWLEEISTYFRKTKGRTSSKHYSTSYVIYAYIDNINHYAYIGLTKNLEYRNLLHKYPDEYGKYDSVGYHFMKNNISMPEPIILYSNLNSNEASQKEIDVYYEYKEKGWNMINHESALGSLGSGALRWTKENIEIEAKKYNTIQEFRKNANYAYYKAKEYGLLDNFTWLKDSPKQKQMGFWTEEKCKECALECKTKKEFEEKYPRAYNKSIKKGWIKQYDWFIPLRNSWTENTCKEVALKCTTHKEFRTKYPGAYNKAKKMKWISSYTWLKRLQLPKDYWNKERCRECALQCKTWKEFFRKFENVYHIAKRNDWLKDYTWLKYTAKPCRYWTEERCRECALKCKTKQEFIKDYNGAYRAARNKKWIKDYYWLEDTQNHWTKELCRELASLCKDKYDFNKKFSKAYRASYNNKWLDEFFK